MTTIIFSKNRAMQLDALLRSMDEYFLYSDKVYVLHLTTNNLHESCYTQLKKEHENIYPIKQYEGHFKTQTDACLSLVKIMGLGDTVCFLVDDDIFYKHVPEIPELKQWETFSLRLGENVGNPNQFKYTISLDGNIFNSSDILPLMEQIKYNNPNELEARLMPFQNQFTMKWFEQYLVGIPHNRVSDSSGCKFTGKYSEDELAEMYLQCKRIDYKAMDFSNIGSVHADIDYKFYEI